MTSLLKRLLHPEERPCTHLLIDRGPTPVHMDLATGKVVSLADEPTTLSDSFQEYLVNIVLARYKEFYNKCYCYMCSDNASFYNFARHLNGQWAFHQLNSPPFLWEKPDECDCYMCDARFPEWERKLIRKEKAAKLNMTPEDYYQWRKDNGAYYGEQPQT